MPIHLADEKPFEAHVVQARIYDDDTEWVVLIGHDTNDRPTRTSAKKDMEFGVENVHCPQGLVTWSVDQSSKPLLMSDTATSQLIWLNTYMSQQTTRTMDLAPAKTEDSYPEVQDPSLEINKGTETDPHLLFVSKLISLKLCAEMIDLLRDYKDCFAWDFHEMPRLPRDLVEHELRIKMGSSLFSKYRGDSLLRYI